jgi:hypothetical protein
VSPSCACLGSLKPAPDRIVAHGPGECVSTPIDGGAETSIVATGRCPRCREMRSLGGVLCRGCLYADWRVTA